MISIQDEVMSIKYYKYLISKLFTNLTPNLTKVPLIELVVSQLLTWMITSVSRCVK